eukprot:4013356-Pleurochrysis_carterae.AAC.2
MQVPASHAPAARSHTAYIIACSQYGGGFAVSYSCTVTLANCAVTNCVSDGDVYAVRVCPSRSSKSWSVQNAETHDT